MLRHAAIPPARTVSRRVGAQLVRGVLGVLVGHQGGGGRARHLRLGRPLPLVVSDGPIIRAGVAGVKFASDERRESPCKARRGVTDVPVPRAVAFKRVAPSARSPPVWAPAALTPMACCGKGRRIQPVGRAARAVKNGAARIRSERVRLNRLSQVGCACAPTVVQRDHAGGRCVPMIRMQTGRGLSGHGLCCAGEGPAPERAPGQGVR